MENKLSNKSTILQLFMVSSITLVIVMSSTINAVGKNYYFSTSIGNDSRSSAQAQIQSSPWKTISKLNTFFSSLLPGDSVLFKRGEIFYGSIIVGTSGTSSLPIIIGAYGTGPNPIISGFTTISSWTSIGNGIYQSAVTTCKSTLNMVTVNGVQKAIGRYPNTGYLTFESHVGTASITDNQLSGTPNWKGAEVVIRKTPYTIGRNPITNHTAGMLTYSKSGTVPKDNFGYFIQNDPKTLDLLGEWYLDPITKKIQMYFGATNPSSYTVKASSLDTLVNCNGKSFVTLTDLDFTGANFASSFIASGQNISLLYCGIDFSGSFGIYNYSNSPNLRIEHCNINHSNHTAIQILSTNASIRYNLIKNTGMIPGMANETGGYNGIGLLGGDGTAVEFNEIDSVGKHGIVMKGNNTLIKNNLINYFALTVDDCGGIYTTSTTTTGRKIIGNIILNGIGQPLGTNTTNQVAKGIFLDEPCSNVEITGNTIANCSLSGLHCNNTHDLVIQNNLFYNNNYSVNMNHSNTYPNDPTKNVSILNNIFFAKTATQIILRMWTVTNDVAKFGTASGNYYCRPIDDNTVITKSDLTTTALSLAGWQTFTGQDKTSKKSPQSITTTNDLRFEYNATNSNKTIALPTPYIDATGKLYTSSITLLPYTSTVLIKSSGTITNQTPTILNQNLQLNENSKNGTVVGTVKASDPDAGQLLTYSIISGNTSGAFTINSSTGVLNVANSAILNFEVTPTFALVVKVQDNGAVSLSNQATVNVSLINVNEPPVIINQSFFLLSNSVNGNTVGTVVATDPDAGQTKSFSIVSGNTNNAFAINSTTGLITVAISTSLNYQTIPSYSLLIKVLDNGTPVLSSQATITVNLTSNSVCSATGNISYQVWNNIGTSPLVSSLTSNIDYPANPTSTSLITSMEGTTNLADGFGARIAGYICAPSTGSYTFWIASDDNGELWLSTDDQPANTREIAYNDAYTGARVWNKYATQKSVSINLVQGQKYYIEALMKEATGGDNLAVGWLKPGQTGTVPSEVIPGSVLSPISLACSAVGNISYQLWNNIGSGVTVNDLTSNINYPNNPTSSVVITSMEGPANSADNYGARIAGYICAPATGNYTFWIASDDYGELWLSTDDQPANTVKIAYVTGYTASRQWDKYATQKSVQISLVQGQRYYIEALMKDASGGNNLAVGWLRPGQTGIAPSEIVPGSVLSPLGTTKSKQVTSLANTMPTETNINLLVYPNPLNSDVLNVKLENSLTEVTIKIFSISGILCHEEVIRDSETIHIDRSVFKSGVYIVKAFNNDFVKTTKLVVK